jgi:hypothetical protein
MEWVVETTPRQIYPGKETCYPLYRTLGGSQVRSRLVRKISPQYGSRIPVGIRFPHRPIHSESSYRLGCPEEQCLLLNVWVRAPSVCIKLYVPTSTLSLFIAIKTEATENCCSQPRFYLTFYRCVALATKLIFPNSVSFTFFRNRKLSFAFQKPASFIRLSPSCFTYLKRQISDARCVSILRWTCT